jgi:hypothetical protein
MQYNCVKHLLYTVPDLGGPWGPGLRPPPEGGPTKQWKKFMLLWDEEINEGIICDDQKKEYAILRLFMEQLLDI